MPLLRALLFFLLAGGSVLSCAGQARQDTPVYDVASIHPMDPGGSAFQRAIMNPARQARFRATGVTLETLIELAYGVQESDIHGLPRWADEKLFSVNAESTDSSSQSLTAMPEAQARAVKQTMLQQLLADRFHLRVHTQPSKGVVFNLTRVAPAAALHPHASDGAPFSVRFDGRTMICSDTPMDFLANFLTQSLHEKVVDATGLTGHFDFRLRFNVSNPSEASVGDGPVLPSLEEALRTQLGLELKRSEATITTYVVDHADPPDAN